MDQSNPCIESSSRDRAIGYSSYVKVLVNDALSFYLCERISVYTHTAVSWLRDAGTRRSWVIPESVEEWIGKVHDQI